jgi:cell division protein FtsB
MSNNKTGLQIVREWAENEYKSDEGTYPSWHEVLSKITEVEKELQSRPVGDVEGYLKGLSNWPHAFPDYTPVVSYKSAIAALKALQADKNEWIKRANQERDAYYDRLQELRLDKEDLTAEVERLKGGMSLGKLRSLINAYLKDEISMSKFLEVVNGKSDLPPNPQP